jgi:hypothetical protein
MLFEGLLKAPPAFGIVPVGLDDVPGVPVPGWLVNALRFRFFALQKFQELLSQQ